MPRNHAPEHTALVLQQRFGQGPFSYREVVGHLVTAEELRAAVNRGLVLRIRRGEYAVGATFASSLAPDVEGLKVKVRAALDVVSGAVVSHHSAAVIHGLPEVGFPNRRALVSLTRPGDHHSRGEGLAISGSGLLPDEIVEVDGMPITSIARTAVDLARLCGMPNALAITDAAARQMIGRGLGDGEPDVTALRDAVHDREQVSDVKHVFQTSLRQMRGWKGVGWARLGVTHLNPLRNRSLSQSRAG